MNKKDLYDIETLLDRKLSGIAGDVATLKEDNISIKERLSNLEKDMKVVKVDLLENNVIPRLSTIEKCYVDTSKRYMEGADRFDAVITDIEVMKLAIQKNSYDIQELKRKQA